MIELAFAVMLAWVSLLCFSPDQIVLSIVKDHDTNCSSFRTATNFYTTAESEKLPNCTGIHLHLQKVHANTLKLCLRHTCDKRRKSQQKLHMKYVRFHNAGNGTFSRCVQQST